MKITAYTVIALDLVLLVLVWLPGAIYIIYNLDTACFAVEFIIHFLILMHFALCMAIAWVASQIESEEEEYKEKFHEQFLNRASPATVTPMTSLTPPPLEYVSYRVYSPLAWIFTGLVSLIGDGVLLAAAIRTYNIGALDECRNSRIAHLAYDTVAFSLSVVTVVWFILFAIFVIAPQRRSEKLASQRIAQMTQTRSPLASQLIRQQQQQRQHTTARQRVALPAYASSSHREK